MKHCRFLFLAILIASPSLLTPEFAQAQAFTGPAGSYTNYSGLGGTRDITNLVWDLSASFSYVYSQFYKHNTNFVASVYYRAPIQQNGAGTIKGGGGTNTTTIYLSYRTKDGQVTNIAPFTGKYRVSGWMFSSGTGSRILSPTLVRGRYTAVASGVAALDNGSHKVMAVQSVQFDVNSVLFTNVTVATNGISTTNIFASRITSQTESDTVSAPGLGTKSARSQRRFGGYPQFFPQGSSAPGAWRLEMLDLATDANNHVTGSTATITTISGQTFTFKIRGHYQPRTGRSILLLRPADSVSRGSRLQVTLVTNTVTRIKGRISGQAVNALSPQDHL
jgi:hypothetical protein